uniref:Sushi domain-containing protein n=1 Tax=Alexandrium monilatum TaxID=311494 RepID=A0A7S4QDK5_9DINO
MQGGLPGPVATALLLAAAALQAVCCAAQCAANAVTVKVGWQASSLSVPALLDGGTFQHNCSAAHAGYEGPIEVHCVGSLLTAYAHACVPRACEAGQSASARVAANNAVTVRLARPLEHGGLRHVACRTLLPGSLGHVRLACRLGELLVDASNCRPKVQGPMTMWRIANGDYLPGTWRVFELSLFTSADCSGGKVAGDIFASSEDYSGEETHDMAFDRDIRTAWAAGCEQGCPPGAAWIGLALARSSGRVRCIELLQSRVACCGSQRVRLEVWDGAGWQNMQVWDTQGLRRMTFGYKLPVPASCEEDKPEGVGVIHDCDGRPVVGRQQGDTCTARCSDGFYGEASTYTCGADGRFQGTGPTCYNVVALGRLAGIAVALLVLLFLGGQYRFFCMHRKLRLADIRDTIPQALFGRWREKSGTNVWEVMLEERQRAMNRSVFDFEAGTEESGADTSKGAEVKKKKRKKKRATQRLTVLKAEKEKEELQRVTNLGFQSLDGLCSPCEDPDICLACVFCPLCRVADTWHTLGKPAWQDYWKVYFSYAVCPFCWPCLGFYGRLRLRWFFQIPPEPHRDCLVYCCCCCCCAPCAACQEARLVDAPLHYRSFYKKTQQMTMGFSEDPEV